MYFTRPKIKPLNWDLEELVEGGTYILHGFTLDKRPIDIKYRGGWLQVWHGDPGALPGQTNYQVVEERIGPPYHGGLLVEQACDLLGMTINGKKPILTEERRLQAAEYQPILDWSGETTYWESHNSMFHDDADNFIDDIEAEFSDISLLQFKLVDSSVKNRKRKCRKIPFYIDSDNHIKIGIGADKSRLNRLLTTENFSLRDIDETFENIIEFQHHPRSNSPKPNEKEFNESRSRLNFNVQYPQDFSVKTKFHTHTAQGKKFAKTFNSIMEKNFFSSFQVIDIETKEILKTHNDENAWNLYSMRQKKWCLEKTDRYLSVG